MPRLAAVLLFFILLAIVVVVVIQNWPQSLPNLTPGLISPAPVANYEAVGQTKVKVTVFDKDVKQVSQLKITPDGKFLLVATLPGKIWVYEKKNGTFVKQPQPFFDLPTSQPGFLTEKAGLSGLVLGADFATSGDIFLDYSFALGPKDLRNRVTRVTFSQTATGVVGKDPIQIFEANTPGSAAHQIQDGVGLMIADRPHLLFTIGEDSHAEKALDPTSEAGKIILLQRDGSVAVGNRPWPNSPKVQAIGIRNAPAIAFNPKTGKVALGDTGPDNQDRFIYGFFKDLDGQNNQELSFNWDGTENSLLQPAVDPYDPAHSNSILFRWAPTQTPVNLAFYENAKLPTVSSLEQYFLISLFGRTGDTKNDTGRAIMLGILNHSRQNSLILRPFIGRTKASEGKQGQPLGLTVDPENKDIYFGDIMEGRIYKAQIM